ncbi:hypothetical protein ACVJGD_008004 [Bradyrhizobium sp. USDA 10063]
MSYYRAFESRDISIENLGGTLTVATVAAPAIWRTEKTILVSGHSAHKQRPSPVSDGFVAPGMPPAIRLRPEALVF